MENKRLKRACLYTLLLFIYFFTILIIPKAHAEVAYIDRESTEVIYPEGQSCVDTNQTAIMSVKVTTPDIYGYTKTYLMAIKVYGENVTIVPSSDQNFTINDGSHKVLECQLKPQIYGALTICIQLWHEGGQIDFYSLPLKADKPPPYVPLIYISESDYLNQLADRGFLKKQRRGREVQFQVFALYTMCPQCGARVPMTLDHCIMCGAPLVKHKK